MATKEETKVNKFWAGIDEKVTALSASLRCKVFPIVLLDSEAKGDFVVGFAKVPDLITQLRLIDKSAGNDNGFSLEACSTALETLLIVSETDKRISDKQDLTYWKGACVSLSQFMGVAIPVLKKK
jgi:hypothetical protein